jgi:HK97 family phage major capsid protein
MKHVRTAALVAAASPLALANARAEPRAIQSFRPRAEAGDATTILAQLQKDFTEFKAANDQRLNAKADVVLDEKVERINGSVTELQAAIDEMSKQLAAARLGGENGETAEVKAYAKAFNAYFRKGREAESLGELAVKAAMTTQSDPDGGYMVTTEMEKTIDRVLMNVSAMRNLAQVRPISTGEYKKLVSQGGATGGWVGERQARTETGTPSLAELAFQAMELYAEPAATQSFLDDAFVDIGAWLADEVSITFAEQEGAAFVTGDGIAKPRGILSYAAVADNVYKWGKIGYYGTGGAGFAADPAGLDALIDVTQGLKQGYRNNAGWLFNRFTGGKIRKLKDSQGHYQWQPSNQVGQPASLLGYPIADDDNMPDTGANAYPVAFADWKRAYLIVDRIGVRVLRDPFTSKPNVLFYTTKRVGGGIQNFEAIKLLKCA